ncbi:MAG: STAS domain-containing protein [Sedimentisphaerales bacterium]|jgi:anti-sigma B factor antagonist
MVEEIVGRILSEGDTAIVTFQKSSISNVEDISIAAGRVAKFVNTSRPMRVVFDFKDVKFFSSRVLGMLLETRATLASWGGQVFISSINPQLHRVFKITNLDQVFEFFPDVDSAVKSPRPGSSDGSG